MKKIFVCLSVLVICLGCFTKTVSAEDYDKEFEFEVVFTSEGKIESDFDDEAASLFDDIQPGDSLNVTFNFKNEYNKPINWYMYNTSEAFESDDAKSAGYEYVLKYSGLSDDVYNSSTVGGDAKAGEKEGLQEATENLGDTKNSSEDGDYFLLQEGFAKGENQTLTLTMVVDGETANNNYQTAASKINFRFAVEIPPENKEEHIHKIVYIPNTGDSINLTFYIVTEILALLLLLAVLVAYYCYRRKQREA